MEYLLLIAIILEALIALLCIKAAIKGKTAFYGLGLTFLIYVWYDLVRYMDWSVDSTLQSGLFMVATISALYTVWKLTK